jgi:hypothetical protein
MLKEIPLALSTSPVFLNCRNRTGATSYMENPLNPGGKYSYFPG